MLEVELVLPMNIGQIHVEKLFLLGHFGVQRRPRHGGVEHELVEISRMRHRVLDLAANVFRRVVFQADYG